MRKAHAKKAVKHTALAGELGRVAPRSKMF